MQASLDACVGAAELCRWKNSGRRLNSLCYRFYSPLGSSRGWREIDGPGCWSGWRTGAGFMRASGAVFSFLIWISCQAYRWYHRSKSTLNSMQAMIKEDFWIALNHVLTLGSCKRRSCECCSTKGSSAPESYHDLKKSFKYQPFVGHLMISTVRQFILGKDNERPLRLAWLGCIFDDRTNPRAPYPERHSPVMIKVGTKNADTG